MQDGYAVLTSYRLLWVSYQSSDTPFDGVPCYLPLGAISETDFQKTFLQLKPSRVKLHVRLDAAGYPSSDALTVARVVKVKLVLEKPSQNTESWYSALQTAVTRQAWKSAPQGLIQEMHTPPPMIVTHPRVNSGPMTPPPALFQSLRASTPNHHHNYNGTGGGGGGSQPVGGGVDKVMLRELVHMGYPEHQAVEALRATNNSTIDAAANWLLDHSSSSSSSSSAAAVGAAAPPVLLTPSRSLSSGPLGEGAGLGTSIMLNNPLLLAEQHQQHQHQQQQQTPTPKMVTRISSLSNVGVGGVLRREERQAAETDRILGEAFTDLSQLMGKAEEMVKLAESFRERSTLVQSHNGGGGGGGGGGTTEDSVMDEALAAELADLGIASPVTRESCGRLYYSELARQVAAVMETSVTQAGGVLPLPEVYRRFNRARFTDLVSPDDLLLAVKRLPVVGAPLRLKVFPSGLKALVAAGLNEHTMWNKIVDLATVSCSRQEVDIIGGGDDGSGDPSPSLLLLWHQALGRGVTRAEAAAALEVPLAVAGEHIAEAEAAGLLCRDDGPEGMRFFKNFFPAATAVVVAVV